MLALAALVLAVQHERPVPEILIGTLRRHPETLVYAIDETPVTIRPLVIVGTDVLDKRVQLLGRRPHPDAQVEAFQLDPVEPAEKDLTLRISARVDGAALDADDRLRLEVYEYSPCRERRHGGSCRLHAWIRARIQGDPGASALASEVRVPAYAGLFTRVFVRASAPRSVHADSPEAAWNGTDWLDVRGQALAAPFALSLSVRKP